MPAKTHGESYTCEYRSWKLMRSRCNNPNDPAYKNYGERGITVCERWDSYDNFLADMGRRPTPKHTLEREKNDLGYSPDNCRWATRREQLRNRRNTRLYTYRGKSMILSDWSRELGIPMPRLAGRVRLKWPVERLFSTERET